MHLFVRHKKRQCGMGMSSDGSLKGLSERPILIQVGEFYLGLAG